MKTAISCLTIILLIIGAVLLPVSRVEAEHRAQGITYVVRAGDTLSGIASRYGIGYQSIMSVNGLKDPGIRAGQVLIIPSSNRSYYERSPYVASNQALSSNTGGSSPADCGSRYVVRRGDTLSTIARRCGSSPSAVQSTNGLSGYDIYVGQVLRIPLASVSLAPHSYYVPRSSIASRSPTPTPQLPVPPAYDGWHYDYNQ